MRDVLIIVQREFQERVRTRAFLLGTIAFPIFMVGVMVLPTLIGSGGGEAKRLVVVDEAPAGIGAAFKARLSQEPETDDDYRYAIEDVAGPFAGVRESLNARVQAEEIDGYVALPPDVLETNTITYRASNIANRRVLRDVTRAASQAAQAERLRRAGLEGAAVAELIRPVRVDQAQITAEGEEGRDAESTFWFAYLVAFLIYFMTVIYGTAVMRSVLEEKTNRISEVMMSSVRANDLMLGKILGVSAAAVAQVAIWAAIIVLLVVRSEQIAGLFGATPESLAMLRVPPIEAALFAAYFLLGFFLFAALFAALGAAITTEQEAQSLQVFVMIPLFLPLLMLGAITNEPMGSAATALGLIPFTAPITMPMRIATAPLPAAQIALSLALLAAAVLLVAWVAGKIYRVGILATGRKATFADVLKWLRAA